MSFLNGFEARKMIRPIDLLTLFASCHLGAASIGPVDPFDGKWNVVAAKSQFRGTPYQGTLVIRDNVHQFSAVAVGGTFSWSKMFDWKYDGRPKRIACVPNRVACNITEAVTRIDDRTVESLTRKRGRVIARTVFTISADHCILTAVTVGETPEGELIDNTVVFEKDGAGTNDPGAPTRKSIPISNGLASRQLGTP
jgi:hypothetical protein